MLDDIVLFINVYETKSFKKSSELLGMQSSTLSKHITELEYLLGKQLLIRTSKIFEPTDFGEYIYNQFKHLPPFTKSTLDNYNKTRINNKYSGELNVAIGAAISYELICPYLDEFLREYPEMKLNISFLPNMVKIPAPHVSIVLTNNYIVGDGLDNRFVRNEKMKFYCTSEYAIEHGIPSTVDEINNHEIISGLNEQLYPMEYFKLKNANTNDEFVLDLTKSRLRLNNAIHTRKVGLNANCIFACFESLILRKVYSGLVVPVLPNWIIHEENFYIVTKKHISQEEELFINFIYECLKK